MLISRLHLYTIAHVPFFSRIHWLDTLVKVVDLSVIFVWCILRMYYQVTEFFLFFWRFYFCVTVNFFADRSPAWITHLMSCIFSLFPGKAYIYVSFNEIFTSQRDWCSFLLLFAVICSKLHYLRKNNDFIQLHHASFK